MERKPPENARVLTYARVSGEMQKERETIDAQRRLLKTHLDHHIAAEGWRVMFEIEDDGISGETISGRPGFSRVMALAEARLFDVLVVRDTDRLTRSRDEMEQATIRKTLRLNNIFISIPGNGGLIDLSNPNHALIFGIQGGFASFDKQKIVEKLLEGRVRNFKNGGAYSGAPPYGYRCEPVQGSKVLVNYVHDEEQVAVVRDLIACCIDGASLSDLVVHLQATGVARRARNHKKKLDVNREVWSHATIYRMLRSTTLKGEWVTLKGTHTRQIPPIVDPETWLRLQHALSARKAIARAPRDETNPRFLLSARVRCGTCGRTMWTSSSKGRPYYRCSSHAAKRLGLPAKCGNPNHNANVLDADVWEILRTVLTSKESLARCASIGAEKVADGVDYRTQRQEAEARIEQLKKLGEGALRRLDLGIIDDTQCDNELLRFMREREKLTRDIEVCTAQLAGGGDTLAWLGRIEEASTRLRGRLGAVSHEKKVEIIDAAFPRGKGWVEVRPDGSWVADAVFVAEGEELPFTFTDELKRAG